MRLLLDPIAETSGGETADVAATSTPTPTPAPAATDAAAVTGVTVSAEEYKTLLGNQAKLAEIEAQAQRDLNEAKQREIDALAKKGEVDQALLKLRESSADELKKEREKSTALETQILVDKKGSEITGLLLGTSFVSDAAAAQARQILDARFEAVRDAAGTVTVREKGTLKPAATVVKDWLASTDSAHFRKASTTGGAGAKGGDQTTATGDADKPMTVSDALIAREKARLAAPDNSFYGLTRRGSTN